MPTSRRDWWLGIVVVCGALAATQAWPRYEWRDPGGNVDLYVRIDRWSGQAEIGRFQTSGPNIGSWASMRSLREDAALDKLIGEIDNALKEK